MVQTQLKLLANSRATRPTLISTICQWLGFLGVRAQVTHLNGRADQIHIGLTVEKPDACDSPDWQQILTNLNQGESEADLVSNNGAHFTNHQQSRMCRLLAYLIQIGNPQSLEWDTLYPQLRAIGLDENTLVGVRSALKVPQSLDDLVQGLDSDVAAVALPKAVSIAMLDRRVNSSEDAALTTLLKVMGDG
jgi:hypothetical protein